MRITNKFNGYSADNRRLYFLDMGGGGGGGGGTTTATTYSSNVPEYAKQPFMEMIGKAEALTQAPYQAYTGERVAQFSPLQQQAYGAAAGQQVAGQLAPATGLAMGAGLGGLSQQSFIQPGTAGAYMSPFMEQALMPQITAAQKQSRLAGQQQAAEAVGRGAFGGTRDAIMRAEREKSLMGQIGDIRAKGYQTAFEQAQNQFNQEQAQRLQGLQLAGQAAGTLGTLGQQQFGQQMGITEQQSQLGAQQRQAMQDILNQRYSDFQAQRDYPYQQIGFMSDLLRGAGGSTRTVYPGASPLQTMAGLGTAAYGLSGMGKMFGAAEGGEVPYASGGITGLLSDQQLAQQAQKPQTPMMGMAAQQEMAERSALRAASAPQEKREYTEEELIAMYKQAIQSGDVELAQNIAAALEEKRTAEESGIAALPVEEGEYADGGIIGFQSGGQARTSGQRMLRNIRDFSEEVSEDPYSYVPWDITGSLRGATDMIGRGVEAVRGIKAGPEVSYQADPNTPSIYAPREEWARYRGQQTEEKQQAARAEQPPVTAGARPDDPSMLAQRYPAPAAVKGDVVTGVGAPKVRGNVTTGIGVPASQSVAFKDGVSPAERYRQELVAAGFDPSAVKVEQRNALAELNAARRAQAQKGLTDYEKMVEGLGTYGKEQEARAKQGLEALAGEQEQAKYMGFLQAGLSILGADPSRGALAAIAQGGIAGLGKYQGDMKELKKNRSELLNKLDRIDEMRRKEAFATGETKLRYQDAINKAEVDAAKDTQTMLQGFGNIDFGVAQGITKAIQHERDQQRADDRAARSEAAALQRTKMQIEATKERIKDKSVAGLSQMRMILTKSIRDLTEKQESGIPLEDDEKELLRQSQADLRQVLSALATRSNVPLATPAAGGKVAGTPQLPAGYKPD